MTTEELAARMDAAAKLIETEAEAPGPGYDQSGYRFMREHPVYGEIGRDCRETAARLREMEQLTALLDGRDGADGLRTALAKAGIEWLITDAGIFVSGNKRAEQAERERDNWKRLYEEESAEYAEVAGAGDTRAVQTVIGRLKRELAEAREEIERLKAEIARAAEMAVSRVDGLAGRDENQPIDLLMDAVVRRYAREKERAAQYEADWVAAKHDFGTAMGKARERLTEVEQQLAECRNELYEVDQALVAVRTEGRNWREWLASLVAERDAYRAALAGKGE